MIKNIIWDFDGVLINSNHIRTAAFEEIFKDFKQEAVEDLINFHESNGGLSRYFKIRYFFEKILMTNVSKDEVNFYAENYSNFVKPLLKNDRLLITKTNNFISLNKYNYRMFIVSASDEFELRELCAFFDFNLFLEIKGSPTNKKENISNLIQDYKLINFETMIIGDSYNDYEAALYNNIHFMAFNNPNLKKHTSIELFK